MCSGIAPRDPCAVAADDAPDHEPVAQGACSALPEEPGINRASGPPRNWETLPGPAGHLGLAADADFGPPHRPRTERTDVGRGTPCLLPLWERTLAKTSPAITFSDEIGAREDGLGLKK
ncbi:hypothetical protein DQ353_16725 [Arthrobacter sp. AQ5-05]|nr:hypothetical protein DQ353_16725 [Arthrobacter sp. AQ5-05]